MRKSCGKHEKVEIDWNKLDELRTIDKIVKKEFEETRIG